MNMPIKTKTAVIIGGIIIIAGAFAFVFRGNIVAHAAANPLASFWSDLTEPLTGQGISINTDAPTIGTDANGTSGTDANGANAAPLYAPNDQYESDVMAAVQKTAPAVVSITISENVPIIENCPNDFYNNIPPEFQQFFGGLPTSTPCQGGGTELQQVGGGSGFIISPDGLILTNKHVVSDAHAQYSVLTNSGKTYTARVLARDPNQDLAVLKIDATGLPTVTLGDSNGLQLGQTAIAIGNALGQFSNTVSVGAVSGLERTVTASSPDTGAEETLTGVIQTDAAINPGNSGGPLVDLRGDVIGIDTAVASGAQNIGFAIPIDQAKSAISSVETTGEIKVPYLGVRYEPVTASLASSDNLSDSYGALVTAGNTGAAAVAPNSPAAAAGIRAGDIIEAVNGMQIDAQHDLGNVINQYSVGDSVTLTIRRGGNTLTVKATLAQRPSAS